MLRTTFSVPLVSYTFAQMKALTGMVDGQLVRVSSYGRGGSTWRYSTTLSDWFPVAPTKVYENTALITGALTVADQLLVAIPCEAGLLANKVFRLIASLGKDGTTDAYGASTTVRLGTAGTTADAAITSGNLSTVLTAGNRSAGSDVLFRMASATSCEVLGSANGLASLARLGSGTVLSSATVVPSVASQLVNVSITTTMGGTTNRPQLGYVALEIQP